MRIERPTQEDGYLQGGVSVGKLSSLRAYLGCKKRMIVPQAQWKSPSPLRIAWTTAAVSGEGGGEGKGIS